MTGKKFPTTFRLSPMDQEDIKLLISRGVYTHPADAVKGTLRKGIEKDMKERGIECAKVEGGISEIILPDESSKVGPEELEVML